MDKRLPSERLRIRRVILSDLEVRLSRLPLDALLRSRGIDPTRSYRQEDRPTDESHVFIQLVEEEE